MIEFPPQSGRTGEGAADDGDELPPSPPTANITVIDDF
jgi:hypothetical protein